MDLTGKVVALTGGGGGIGTALTGQLTDRGALVAVGDLDPDRARETASQAGEGAAPFPLDVRDRASFARFLVDTTAALGPVDVLVNNAGLMSLGAFLDESDETHATQIGVNLTGAAIGMKLALPAMVERGDGQVVNVASMGGKFALPGAASYTATKFALVGLTEALRSELRDTGVALTLVLPAMVDTELAGGVPRGRGLPLVKPEQVAAAIVGAIEHRHLDVYVPGWMRLAAPLPDLAPRFLVNRVRRLMRDDRVLNELDADTRAGYEARIRSDAE